MKLNLLLFIPLLLILFAETLFSYESEQSNIEIEMLSDSPDFDVIHNSIHNFSEESETVIQYLDNSRQTQENFTIKPEGFNILKWPNLSADARTRFNFLTLEQTVYWLSGFS